MALKAATSRATVSGRTTSVRVCCSKQETGVAKTSAAFAAVAASVLLQASSASAGVILEQPQLKKVLQADATPAAAAVKKEIILPGMRKQAAKQQAAAPKVKAAKPEASVQGGDLDPKAIALPGSLALIGAGAFALLKLDDGFADFMSDASCKDSGAIGAGYEPAIKEGGLAAAGKPKSRPASKPGTKKVKAAGKSSGGTGFSLGGLLNKE